MRLVLVKWLDAISHESGWKAVDKVRTQKPPLVRSVGYLVADTKEHVTIVSSIVEGDCDGDVTIPRGMIKSIEDLAVRK